jgi:hypothetical protein
MQRQWAEDDIALWPQAAMTSRFFTPITISRVSVEPPLNIEASDQTATL